MNKFRDLGLSLVLVLTVCGSAFADNAAKEVAKLNTLPGEGIQRADQETISAASGHYSRARSLLIAAIREFDQGLALVDPDAILDAGAWRSSIIDRASELEHVLDPQPRVSKGGVKYGADTRLLNQGK